MSNSLSGFLTCRSGLDPKSSSAPAIKGDGPPGVANCWFTTFGRISRDCHDGWTVVGR